MKTLFTTLSILCFFLTINAQETIKLSDFEVLNNTSWKGTLTYKDYSSRKSESIETTLQIKIEGGKIKFSTQYVYEPHKNHNSSVKIKKKGNIYGNEKVIQNTLENDTRTVVTTYNGKDNGEKATFYITRKFNEKEYSVTKEVLLENATDRFVRNSYTFQKRH